MAMCKTMRNVVAGGEALTPALAARFQQRLPHVHLHNTYGPTEATIDITGWLCKPHMFCAGLNHIMHLVVMCSWCYDCVSRLLLHYWDSCSP